MSNKKMYDVLDDIDGKVEGITDALKCLDILHADLEQMCTGDEPMNFDTEEQRENLAIRVQMNWENYSTLLYLIKEKLENTHNDIEALAHNGISLSYEQMN